MSESRESEHWPVLPEGVEGVLLLRATAGMLDSAAEEVPTCFVCGQDMPDVEQGQMCWGIPGRGLAHDDCYRLEDDDA